MAMTWMMPSLVLFGNRRILTHEEKFFVLDEKRTVQTQTVAIARLRLSKAIMARPEAGSEE
jgi:hypothetical protein